MQEMYLGTYCATNYLLKNAHFLPSQQSVAIFVCHIFTPQLVRYYDQRHSVAAIAHSSLHADKRVCKIGHKQPAKGVPTGLAILMKSHWVNFFHIDLWNGFSLIGMN